MKSKGLFIRMALVGLDACQTAAPLPSPSPSAYPLGVAIAVLPSATPSLTASPLPPSLTPSPPAPSPTASPSPTAEGACPPPPADWVAYTVQAGDTWFAFQLGTGNSVTVEMLMMANCVAERWLFEGQVIYLPAGAAENAPSSESAPTPYIDPHAPPPPQDGGLTRTPACPCEIVIEQGWRLEQIAEKIDSLPLGFYGRDFLRLAGRGSPYADRPFMAGAPAGSSLEGYFLPASYTVTDEMDAGDFITLVLDAFGAALGERLNEGAGRGLTPYGVVTLASIINRESRSYAQQVLIASVFHNRLAAGRGLGATVTLQYALGRPGAWWPNVAGRVSTTDSPYNTHLYAGLPPSPIASPSLNALQAALNPADTPYLFFTANCRGSGNVFAVTYEEHLAHVRCE